MWCAGRSPRYNSRWSGGTLPDPFNLSLNSRGSECIGFTMVRPVVPTSGADSVCT